MKRFEEQSGTVVAFQGADLLLFHSSFSPPYPVGGRTRLNKQMVFFIVE